MTTTRSEASRASAILARDFAIIFVGLLALFAYIVWWLSIGLETSLWLLIPFVAALIYTLIQMVGNWTLYLAAHRKAPRLQAAITELTVDVFVTACGEDPALVERTLLAAHNMHGNHRTWLLDDASDYRLEQLANRIGVNYKTRDGNVDAKAGNLNATLACSDGDIVVIFDIDHAPEPTFLLRSLPHFVNPEVGFVQVMLTFDNNADGWVAQAAGESSMDFYNPTSVGADRVGSATLIGSNALIRRIALDDIGGYKPGLAEDLATSIRLHAAGWQSRYVHEPLAPGIAPPDLTAWFNQQFKWSRGVFELLLTAYPQLFSRLHVGQKLSYAVRMTYYWAGAFIAAHMLAAILVLFSSNETVRLLFESYLIVFIPLMIVFTLIRQIVLTQWKHESLRSSLQFKPFVLVFNTWPVYTISWLMALLRLPLSFRPTPKVKADRFNYWWLAPHLITVSLLITGLGVSVIRQNSLLPLTLLFVVGMVALHGLLFALVLQPSNALFSPVASPIIHKQSEIAASQQFQQQKQYTQNADPDY
jgi:cellulose synthase/poly-beta-1,6-N-acetylglucosamine synthase-like glycosyltransferase